MQWLISLLEAHVDIAHFVGATSVTFLREHIALRHVESLIEHRISQGLQLMVHVLWLLSCWNDYQVRQASSAATDHTGIPLIWCVGFAVLACESVSFDSTTIFESSQQV